jgi:L-iditol 2-dehydrogenase
MKVARYYRNDDVRLEEMPRPAIGPGEMLVRIGASGICGSDVLEWYRVPRAPLVLGHEIAGEVVEVGDGVSRFRAGQRVAATHHVPCNTCRHCLAGHHTVCDTLHSTTFDPGGFAEFVRLPAINVDRGTFVLPDGVSDEEGTFLEPLACTVRAQRIAAVGPGDAVLVLGSGIAGLLQIMLARAAGAGPIVATDLSDYRLEAARRLGADVALSASEDVAARTREILGGRLADRVLVCTAAEAAVRQSFAAVARGGTILLFAPLPPGTEFLVPLHDLWKRGVTVTHSYAGAPADLLAALDLIGSGRVEVTPLVTHRLGLDEASEGFRHVAQADRSLKVILEPRR